ncbi:hypothetical protein BYT27DRAFT_7182568 [Phlegmacium glaucopus]|nr:hypothetical protein BYT27DRAFT_7182568 [Phlegmacium glaucopus]
MRRRSWPFLCFLALSSLIIELYYFETQRLNEMETVIDGQNHGEELRRNHKRSSYELCTCVTVTGQNPKNAYIFEHRASPSSAVFLLLYDLQ